MVRLGLDDHCQLVDRDAACQNGTARMCSGARLSSVCSDMRAVYSVVIMAISKPGGTNGGTGVTTRQNDILAGPKCLHPKLKNSLPKGA
jgi:hypothetical protein